MTIITFPIRVFAEICSKQVGADIHEDNGAYYLELTDEQLELWRNTKRKVGVC